MYCGFSKKVIPGLVCQKDKKPLTIHSETQSDEYVIHEGSVVCGVCGTEYIIHEGILDILSHQSDPGSIILSEIQVRDEKADIYDGKFAARYHKEVPSTVRELGVIHGKKIIEYGCGTGRLSLELLQSEMLLASDFSRNSLVILSRKITTQTNVGLVLANAVTYTTAKSFFDRALSAQVFEHIPDIFKRKEFLMHVHDTLVTGGVFVSSVYHQDIRRRIHKKPNEGMHDGKIFFHYFTHEELTREFSAVFGIRRMVNIDITLPFEIRLKLDRFFKGTLSRLCESIPYIQELGHLLLVTSYKKSETVLPGGPQYTYGLFFPWLFKKQWFWFTRPHDVRGVSMVNFFSYEKVDVPGFKRKEGLTSVIDLRKPLDEIWSAMRETFIREQIKRGQNNGIVVRHDDNFEGFKEMLYDFRKKKGLPQERFASFLHGTVFSAYHEGILLAGVIYIGDGTSLRAWQIASRRLSDDKNQNGLIGRANRMVVWEAVKWAKEAGFERFDLGGIDPESRDAGVARVAEFKEAFGGERLAFYHYSKIYSPVLTWYNRLRNKLV